ncbi:hypothetical protein L7F22_056640 [Adiantum nelumboides]|nr:hypothetical protein [Adiantum nelumboides]
MLQTHGVEDCVKKQVLQAQLMYQGKAKKRFDEGMIMLNVTAGHDDVDGHSSGSEHSLMRSWVYLLLEHQVSEGYMLKTRLLAAMESHVGREETGSSGASQDNNDVLLVPSLGPNARLVDDAISIQACQDATEIPAFSKSHSLDGSGDGTGCLMPDGSGDEALFSSAAESI